jgi:hypothetical protein
MASEPTTLETITVTDTDDQKNGSVRLASETPVRGYRPPISSTREKPKFKNIPEDWKAIPAGRFRKIITDIETVLLEISVDGKVASNPFDWRPTIPTLEAWANHLRSALKELTK